MKEEQHRPVIAIDFDGVLNKYKGWKNKDTLYKPQSGARYFLQQLYKNYDITIFTCRDIRTVHQWLQENKLDQYITTVTNLKPIAHAYIDDRAIPYKGNYKETLNELKKFKPWWQKQ